MIVARVNEYEIKEQEFLAELKKILRESGKVQPDREAKEKALDSLINGAIILEKARSENIAVSQDQAQEEMINLQMRFKTKEEFEEALACSDCTEDQLLEKIQENLMVRNYLESCVKNDLEVDDNYLHIFYKKNIDLFKNVEMIRASHILTKPDEGIIKAQELRDQINSPEDFYQVAEKCSECPSGCQAGNLGYIIKGKMVPEFEEVAFKMKVNEISQPVKTKHGYHIIMVTDRKEAGTLSFDEVKDALKRRLAQIDYEIKLDKHVKKLREEADIYINKEYLGFDPAAGEN